MKRRVIVAALALLLAMVALVTLHISLDQTAAEVELQVLASLGDRTAAEGLSVDYRIGLNELRWEVQYDPATGQNDTDFSLKYGQDSSKVTVYTSLPYVPVCTLLDGTDEKDPITSALWKNLERSEKEYLYQRVYPIDYYDVYPVGLMVSYGSDVMIDTSFQETISFPLLQIPVGEFDFFDINYMDHSYRDTKMLSAYMDVSRYMENRFTAFSLSEGDEYLLTTVGFAADVSPEPSWAPEGFGLWYIPIGLQREYDEDGGYSDYVRPLVDEAEIVYPLDIEKQRVVLLENCSDGAYILLVTVEEGRFILRVLDSHDYHLVQQLDLAAAWVSEWSTSMYLSEEFGDLRLPEGEAPYQLRDESYGQLLDVFYQDDPEVSIHQGENFAAVVIGSQLVLLTPDGEAGYQIAFSCDTLSAALVTTDGNSRWRILDAAWPEEEAGYDEVRYDYIYETVDAGYAMAYDGQRLAVACYDEQQSGIMLVSVYDADGLQYAEVVASSLTDQAGTGKRNYWSMLWQDDAQDDDLRNFNIQPALAWET